ncbi:hypothetical protein B0H14DRAFT_3892573 [Mycena olivaceomarginata]|nr:hypothetical protein B0H14DRAFT_3892573 [Mycena olivaceomarginata]
MPLRKQDDNLELEARVDIASISGGRREKADQLAVRIWNRMKYRFVYHSKYEHKRTPSTRFMYHYKDWAEINAFLAEYPEAKHQLCFWHALRAVKTRLAILRRAPAHYAVAVAHAEFDWIDTKFVPLSQLEEINGGSNTYVVTQPIPQLNIRLRGVPVTTAPHPPNPSLTFRINGTVRNIIPRPNFLHADNPSSADDAADSADEEGDLLDEVERFLEKDSVDEQDAEDGPDWLFDDGEIKSSDPSYVFCPAPHEDCFSASLRSISVNTHYSQPRMGPSPQMTFAGCRVQDVSVLSAPQTARSLGYFWTSWYATKDVETLGTLNFTLPLASPNHDECGEFWKQLKHGFLHNHLRPRLDQLVWILVTQVTPAYLLPSLQNISLMPWELPPQTFGHRWFAAGLYPFIGIQSCITDGDDHAWSYDPKVLTGGGGWRELDFSTTSLLGKRAREDSDSGSSAEDVEEIQRHFFPSFDTHDSDDKEQIDQYTAHLLALAEDFDKAAAILRAQVPHKNKLWMSSIVNRKIGGDVVLLVATTLYVWLSAVGRVPCFMWIGITLASDILLWTIDWYVVGAEEFQQYMLGEIVVECLRQIAVRDSLPFSALYSWDAKWSLFKRYFRYLSSLHLFSKESYSAHAIEWDTRKVLWVTADSANMWDSITGITSDLFSPSAWTGSGGVAVVDLSQAESVHWPLIHRLALASREYRMQLGKDPPKILSETYGAYPFSARF